VALQDRFEAAHDVLYSAPCDLTVARRLVREYQDRVRLAVGADIAVEPGAGQPRAREQKEQ
ncbi:MAG TPA: hypothetical protein VNC41_04305, partial [Acidimicrobiia bacterium]|nr:hypothetical protein [Acidimicrobiia bacterium]